MYDIHLMQTYTHELVVIVNYISNVTVSIGG